MSSRPRIENLPRLSSRRVDSPIFSDSLNGQVDLVEVVVLSQFFEQGLGGLVSAKIDFPRIDTLARSWPASQISTVSSDRHVWSTIVNVNGATYITPII